MTQTLWPGKKVSQGQGHPCCSEGLLGIRQIMAVMIEGNEVLAEGRTWAKVTKMVMKMCLCFRDCMQINKH